MIELFRLETKVGKMMINHLFSSLPTGYVNVTKLRNGNYSVGAKCW